MLDVMIVEELTKYRGAFFGSIHATLNHLLWGDMLWFNRFDPSTPSPKGDLMDSKSLFATHAEWQVERIVTDVRTNAWAKRITKQDLDVELTMFSSDMQADVTEPMGMCVPHFFNHQTHHRGQVTALLTRLALEAPCVDLVYFNLETGIGLG